MLGTRATGDLSARYRPLVLDFRILGPLEVVAEHGPVRLGGTRQRATLAILLLNANRVVPIEQIADDLYAGAPPVTAVTQVQRQISELRKLLGSESLIETRSPGYTINVDADAIDLKRFERSMDDGNTALAAGDAQTAADCFSRGLALWRGEALADLRYESFAQAAIDRLEELRIAATEQRIEAELLLGRHPELIPELEALAAEHPLREPVHAQLMRALYASGRQAEALEVYRAMRTRFDEELGIEPTPGLRALEQSILRHDPELTATQRSLSREPASAPILVVANDVPAAADLLSAAVPIAGAGGEVVVACLLENASQLRESAIALNRLRAAEETAVRTAAFTSHEPVEETLRLASVHGAAAVLVEYAPSDDANLPERLAGTLLRSPADVALLTKRIDFDEGDGVYAVFGGSDHDWAALELGARLAAARSAPLRLVGTASAHERTQRDSSRLLADAALAVQRVVGVDSEPVLADATPEGLSAAVSSATLVVAGISSRWRQTGIGGTRQVLVHGDAPAIVVHRGLRPGILAPRQASTRYTWSLQP